MSRGYIVLYRLIVFESPVASGKESEIAAGMLPPLFSFRFHVGRLLFLRGKEWIDVVR